MNETQQIFGEGDYICLYVATGHRFTGTITSFGDHWVSLLLDASSRTVRIRIEAILAVEVFVHAEQKENPSGAV